MQLDVRTPNPPQRVQTIGLAPAKPAAKLIGVQRLGVAGIAGKLGDRGQLGRAHRLRLERQQRCSRHEALPSIWHQASAADRHIRSEASLPAN
jgi:hypothetical protein